MTEKIEEKKQSRAGLIAAFVIIAVALALPPFLMAREQYFVLHILCLIGIYMLLALGLNIIIGFTGILNLGFAAFYGIGAYTGMLLSIHYHLSFWILLPVCGVVSAVAGMLLGWPTLRLRGDYIAIVTLGFVEIVRLGLNNLDFLTNGPKGLPRVGETIAAPHISLGGFVLRFDNDMNMYYLIFAILLLAVGVVMRLHNSRAGRSWVAIREDEIAAEAMGVNTTIMKTQAFAAGTFFAGVAGCIYAHWIGFITPELFTFWESVLIVCMIVLGGIGGIGGVLLGTALIVGIPELLREVLSRAALNMAGGPAAHWTGLLENVVVARMLIFGLIMVIMVIFRPQGIIPAARPRVTLPRKSGGD